MQKTRIGWLEKWTLRYAVMGLVFLAVAGLEGVLMRIQLLSPEVLRGMESLLMHLRPGRFEPTTAELFYSVLTVHPIVAIYGFAYMCVMGHSTSLYPSCSRKRSGTNGLFRSTLRCRPSVS